MIYAVIGLFKQPVGPRDSAFEAAVNEQLAQPQLRIVHAGYLRGAQGEPVGVLVLLDVASVAQAQAYAANSPYQRGGFFERLEVAEYDVEVGRLG